MDTRVLLYALPGMPLHVDDLMPQPLLARCAGALRAHGHGATIVDDGTLDALESLLDDELPHILAATIDKGAPIAAGWKQLFSSPQRGRRRALALFLKRRIDRALAASGEVDSPPNVVVLLAQRRKDLHEARQLAEALKMRWPRLCIALAGKMAVRFGRQVLMDCNAIDVACTTRPESSVPSLAARWDAPATWPQIPGIICRADANLFESPDWGATALPASAIPAYHPESYPALREGGKFNLFTLNGGRGLNHQGHYRGKSHGRAQARSVRQLRREMIALHELYGTQAFHVTGSHTSRDGVIEFARECITMPFPVAYSRDAHVFELCPNTVSLLSTSGCQSLGFSLLTGSQITLSDYFGENWSISDVESCLRACRESGIFLHTDFIYPVPADDYHSRAETIRLLHRCKPGTLRLLLPHLIPGSAWHQHAAEFDFATRLRQLEDWISTSSLTMNTFQEAARLPFTFAGRKRSTIAGQLKAFDQELEGICPPIESGCQAGLIARISGEQGRENRFIHGLERAMKTLNIAALRNFVDTFNIHATASINTVDFYPPSIVKKVMGN